MKLLFVLNESSYFLSHRMAIGLDAVNRGWEVHVAAPGACPESLNNTGIKFHSIKLSRKGSNPFYELRTILILYKLFKEISPDIAHLITIKPYLYGGIAARLARVPSVVSAVAGLGILFSSQNLKYRVLRSLLYPLFKLSLGHKSQKVIFQNRDDRKLLLDWSVLSLEKSVIIRGSGVDLNLCPYTPEPKGVAVVSFAARLLIDKGVEVFASASRILKERGVNVHFWLIGEPDNGNPNTVSEAQLKEWQSEGLVELLGLRNDIPELFASSNIVVLPSFYGEGLPKVLVEAAACGRAVITTNHPGCRDAIEPDKTGILIPIKDSLALANAIEYLIDNPQIRNDMGVAGRILAENEYAIEIIVEAHVRIYNDLLKQSGL
ncbi:MAG: glycosyltransferase family 4 protein [Methylococcales bacterium]|nr:glycosyltransferase family 4 protein [Methylococcales bacterium]